MRDRMHAARRGHAGHRRRHAHVLSAARDHRRPDRPRRRRRRRQRRRCRHDAMTDSARSSADGDHAAADGPAAVQPVRPGVPGRTRTRSTTGCAPRRRRYVTPIGLTIITRYDDVSRTLRSNDFSRDVDANATPRDDPIFERRRERRNGGAKTILNLDPPDHTRLRRLVSKAFTPSAIEALRSGIEAQVDAVLDGRPSGVDGTRRRARLPRAVPGDLRPARPPAGPHRRDPRVEPGSSPPRSNRPPRSRRSTRSDRGGRPAAPVPGRGRRGPTREPRRRRAVGPAGRRGGGRPAEHRGTARRSSCCSTSPATRRRST